MPDDEAPKDFKVIRGTYPIIESQDSLLIECLKSSSWVPDRTELQCENGVVSPESFCGSE